VLSAPMLLAVPSNSTKRARARAQMHWPSRMTAAPSPLATRQLIRSDENCSAANSASIFS
jgi:hypothetical protein